MKTDFTNEELSEQIHINEDEAAVLVCAMKLVGDDVDEYREWLKKQEQKRVLVD